MSMVSATAPSSYPASSCSSILTESVSNASFGIYMPKYSGTIYEILSAPNINYRDHHWLYRCGRNQIGSSWGSIILVTARLFVSFSIAHPVWMVASLLLTAVTFSFFRLHYRHLGRRVGKAADRAVDDRYTPLTFLGGSFYSINMLPPLWQKSRAVSIRSSTSSVDSAGASTEYRMSTSWSVFGMILIFLLACFATVWIIFRTGYKTESVTTPPRRTASPNSRR